MQTAPPVLPEAFSFQTPGGPRGPEGLRTRISSGSPDDAVEPCHPAPESQSGLWSSALAVSTSEPKGHRGRGVTRLPEASQRLKTSPDAGMWLYSSWGGADASLLSLQV